MLSRKKSIVICFVIGALLCTLISCGKPDGMSADDAMTVAFVTEGLSESETENDVRKSTREENTREYLKTAGKNTEDASGQDPEASPEAAAVNIAVSSMVGGIAGYGATVQSERTALANDVRPGGSQTEEERTEPESAVAPELENKVVATVADTYLNIRLEPSEDSEIIGRLYEGSAGEILEKGEGWTKISSGGVEGWVHNDYVVSGEEAQSFAEESLTQVATVTEEGVRVRAEASLDAAWIGVVELNGTYRVVPEEAPEEPVEQEVETEPETESTDVPETQEAPAEAEEPEASGEDYEMPASLEAPVGAEALVIPETGAPDETGNEAEPEETQPEETQAVPELEWVRIIYDGDQEGYVCADYVTVSFVLGKAKSMEEIRAEEEAAARAAAEKAAAEKAAAERAAAEKAEQERAAAAAGNTSAGSGWVSLGEFKITAYCGCTSCTYGAGITASGTVPAEGRTIGVAPWLIPYGTRVKISGMDTIFVAEDTGGFMNTNPRLIDIYCADHNRALNMGVSYREVWIQQ